MDRKALRFVKRYDLDAEAIRAAGHVAYVLPEHPDRNEFNQYFGSAGERKLVVYDNQSRDVPQGDGEGWRVLYDGYDVVSAWSAYEAAWMVESYVTDEVAELYLFSPGDNDYHVLFGRRSSLATHRKYLDEISSTYGRYVRSLPISTETQEAMMNEFEKLTVR